MDAIDKTTNVTAVTAVKVSPEFMDIFLASSHLICVLFGTNKLGNNLVHYCAASSSSSTSQHNMDWDRFLEHFRIIYKHFWADWIFFHRNPHCVTLDPSWLDSQSAPFLNPDEQLFSLVDRFLSFTRFGLVQALLDEPLCKQYSVRRFHSY